MIGYMPCNPAIGGTAKGHLVREIDALGGVMGRAIDATGIQFKLLNRSRGPAVWSPRAQADKVRYSAWLVSFMAELPGVAILADRVVGLDIRAGRVRGVVLEARGSVRAAAVVVTTGTFLAGVTHLGESTQGGGRYGEPPSTALAAAIRALGLDVGRMKTGTPPRLERATIDFDRQVQAGVFSVEVGDERPVPFSFSTQARLTNHICCWSLYSSAASHEEVRANIDKSPLYNGSIRGIGPRYCPSFEDKVMKFPGKERHQIHLEPEGVDSDSIYVNGLSMSFPAEVQERIVRSLPGLEEARLLRPGYAVEYDFVQPTALSHSLELRAISGLFFAGQINGTSGYEEAAAQGLVSGINAARHVRRETPVEFDRAESYIGTLVDDLVSRGCLEPYRMFTSRAEHRLSLRIDNADQRLTPVGRRIGLVSDDQWELFARRMDSLRSNRSMLRRTRVCMGGKAVVAASALKRPGVTIETLRAAGLSLQLDEDADGLISRSLEAEVKYEGYLRQEQAEVRALRRQRRMCIPAGVHFAEIPGISAEVAQRLTERRPSRIGHAASIPGVTPASLAVLCAYLGQQSNRSVGDRNSGNNRGETGAVWSRPESDAGSASRGVFRSAATVEPPSEPGGIRPRRS
jgi:tRNA uridine 5-carboxymethylaminomethyl modification enzyme